MGLMTKGLFYFPFFHVYGRMGGSVLGIEPRATLVQYLNCSDDYVTVQFCLKS